METGEIFRCLRRYLEAEREGGVYDYLFSSASKKIKMDLLQKTVSQCQRCPLSKTRKNIVFGEGNVNARLMFVGEAPGFEEDIEGRPFVGEAGRLLTDIIKAMGFKRDEVYICNILKCRPPNNRNPLPEEISMCIDYLYKQIDYIQPQIICGLGKFASQTLLATNNPITSMRGKWYDFKGIRFMPTYHPAYILRNPNEKKVVWQDMKKIMEELSRI